MSPLLAPERAEIARLARRLRPDGLVVGTSGNLSARSGNLVAITPSGLDYDDLSPELVCVVDLGGRVVEGALAPSLELPMHLAVYRRTGWRGVAHTHSLHATAIACTESEIPPIHYLIAELGGPVRVAPYATFGTEELARGLVEALRGRAAALLQSHGAVTTGSTLAAAYARALTLEWLASLHAAAHALGRPARLADEEVEALVGRMARYGQAALPPGRGASQGAFTSPERKGRAAPDAGS